MTKPADSVSQQLALLNKSSAFATKFSIRADPQLQVEGVGLLTLPISVQTAHHLCAVAQPAFHGYKDETRLDPSVRDTWEIPADKLRFDAPQWADTLQHALRRIARDLGLNADTPLQAQLHNLLVYAPGQFFTLHQDSEKVDGMLGSLVITLPSAFTGGEFIVSHQGETLRSRSSRIQLGLMAFYADCHHEVRPVESGYRVVLTYNLLTQGAAQAPAVPSQAIDTLTRSIQDFWQSPPAPRWQGDNNRKPPERLVYLLDHQYTASGLSWGRLKGADVARVAALREAAQRLDAEIFLTLADVHETWSAEDSYVRRGRRSTTPHPPLDELIDSEIELRHWLALDGQVLPAAGDFASEEELCLTRPSVDYPPFETEYEGYMGNYGNTVDRWYHRAAIVMWPRTHDFRIKAKLAPHEAMEHIGGCIARDDSAQAMQLTQQLLPVWQQAAHCQDPTGLFALTLPVATGIGHAPTAEALLAPFTILEIQPEQAPWLQRLGNTYGLPWYEARLTDWRPPIHTRAALLNWVAQTLPALVQNLCQSDPADNSTRWAAAFIAPCWAWLQQDIDQDRRYERPTKLRKALSAASAALLGLLRACHLTGSTQHTEAMLTMLCAPDWPLAATMTLLRAAQQLPRAALPPAVTQLYHHCLTQLETQLAQPPRQPDDWAIAAPPAPDLETLAEPLLQFLHSAEQQRLEWPLGEAKRQAIERFLRNHELPVDAETRRQGSPYTLILEKTPALFKQAAAQRKQWQQDQRWLQQQAASFL